MKCAQIYFNELPTGDVQVRLWVDGEQTQELRRPDMESAMRDVRALWASLVATPSPTLPAVSP